MKQLPLKEPNPLAWKNIEQGLNDEIGAFKTALKTLPAREPSAFLWEKIVKEIHLPKKNYLQMYIMAAVAASLLAFIVNFFLKYEFSAKEAYVISYSTEYVSGDFSEMEFNFEATDKAKEYLSSYCKTFETKCESEEYMLLNSAFNEIIGAIEKTEELIEMFPNDPELNLQLMNYKKKEAKITRQLLMLTMKHS
ncbi:MAG: hypothetical protein H0X62_03045 [Bacteroidetes bacterium]|nr:hypothetical protein [Bacteroidota bacterium]